MNEKFGIAMDILSGILEPQEEYLVYNFDKLNEFYEYLSDCDNDELLYLKNYYKSRYLAIEEVLSKNG